MMLKQDAYRFGASCTAFQAKAVKELPVVSGK